MPRNVEIKARLFDFDRLDRAAKTLCGADPEILIHEDTFYKVPHGRLKLRNFKSGQTSQLIFYNRADTKEAKLSDYNITPVTNPEALNLTLSAACGQIGSVSKRRHLYIYGQTRIHVDSVDGLGPFMELEVVLTDEQTVEQGQQIANDLMKKLEIPESDLVVGAYLDLPSSEKFEKQ